MPTKGVVPPQFTEFRKKLASTLRKKGGYHDIEHFNDIVRQEFHATPGPPTFRKWNDARDRVAKISTGLHWQGLNKAASKAYHRAKKDY